MPFWPCGFHTQNYTKIKLTNNPKTEAGINLLRISKKLSYCNSAEFNELLSDFYSEFGEFLQEKSINEKGKIFYTHKRLRSAYLSLKRNLSLFFTYEKFNTVPKRIIS
ncbi:MULTISPECIES: hypothetical protein [unclassified Campylobacter]|uniref:hypothetical protein n=1 Tax=unclassified Campylobacter TaxID=2593542 RepID=UPI0022E9E7D2|nr:MULTISPECIES: hypothetical protein [unclassified Campylobacter]MDA3062482.1 hypothetical protein [Campylobacter sp. JMF_14 EL1]MDA3073399.1 hypothetical protein [Campylobacter sp. JMF_10 EL2]